MSKCTESSYDSLPKMYWIIPTGIKSISKCSFPHFLLGFVELVSVDFFVSRRVVYDFIWYSFYTTYFIVFLFNPIYLVNFIHELNLFV